MPTIIFIRIGKHSVFYVASFDADVAYVLINNAFTPLSMTPISSVKPVMVVCSDGGSEQNPRCPRVVLQVIDPIKTYDLDAMYIMTNDRSKTAFNIVEWRMARLNYLEEKIKHTGETMLMQKRNYYQQCHNTTLMKYGFFDISEYYKIVYRL